MCAHLQKESPRDCHIPDHMGDKADVSVQPGLRLQAGVHKVAVGLARDLLADLVHPPPSNDVMHHDHVDHPWLWMHVPLCTVTPQAIPQPLGCLHIGQQSLT